MQFLPTLASLSSYIGHSPSTPCIAFDANWNLLAFGLNGKDWNAGTQDTWSSSTAATDITASNRPPFDTANTTCYLSQQYTNAIYAINADSKNPSSLYIYDATAKSWSTQAVDADALSQGNLFSLDMGSLSAANSTPLNWVNDEQVPYPSGYVPVMALAQNHIHFLDVPNVPAGSADIFVIHYSYFQPQSQAYPLPNGSAFPATYGQVASFFQADNTASPVVSLVLANSFSLLMNPQTNTTQVLAAPTTKDPKSTYFAGVTAVVQLTSNGTVSYLAYLEGNTSTNIAATWASVSNLATAAPPSSSSSSSGSSGNASGTHSASSPSSTIASGATLGASVQYSMLITCALCLVAFVV
ncbi:hypothetical protein BDR07DRAFT_1426531 [Suillus spraguei]|nr:hypothetical protein BDR07DRAFT_1426531 [Suillus spraguei]